MPYSSENYAKHTHPIALYQCSTFRYLQRLYALFRRTRARSVLEVGCGEGFVLDFLMKRQPEAHYTGVDLSAGAVAMARRITAPGIDYACGHGARLPFASGTFDLVVLSEVLEHVPLPEPVLQEALRLSRGRVLISVPLEPYFQGLSNLLVRLKLGRNPGHVNFWTAGRFRRWLAQHADVTHYERCDLYQLALCDLH